MNTYDSNLFAKLGNGTGYNQTNVQSILNPYVNFHAHDNTQTLQDVLVAESIQMRGIECFYIPREYKKLDMIFGEDLESKFERAYKFAAYLNTFDNYAGANTFYSKFGVSVNDEVTISINPNLFKHQCNGEYPTEGSLFYFKMDNSLFEITWVEPYDPFYQVGKNAIIKITAQKFIYSGEKIKPVLQEPAGIDLEEFNELDLMPVRSLDGLGDINIDQYSEVKQINAEAAKFVKPYVVINNRGSGPFDDFMDD